MCAVLNRTVMNHMFTVMNHTVMKCMYTVMNRVYSNELYVYRNEPYSIEPYVYSNEPCAYRNAQCVYSNDSCVYSYEQLAATSAVVYKVGFVSTYRLIQHSSIQLIFSLSCPVNLQSCSTSLWFPIWSSVIVAWRLKHNPLGLLVPPNCLTNWEVCWSANYTVSWTVCLLFTPCCYYYYTLWCESTQ